MKPHFHLPLKAICLIGMGAALTFSIILFNNWQPTMAAAPIQSQTDFAAAEAAMIAGTHIEPELLDYLSNNFCTADLCLSGSWAEWIILAPDSNWEIADLQLLRKALLVTIHALEDEGFDGHDLLSGYRFRHSQGIYLPGELGTLARVHFDRQEIILADGALKKQWGFYIFHELGHVVDWRLGRALRHEFQRSTLGEPGVGSEKTAGGFWINKFALQSPAEAAADAFALWIVLYHTTNPQPVFWLKPEDTDYELIAGVMDGVLKGLDIGVMIR